MSDAVDLKTTITSSDKDVVTSDNRFEFGGRQFIAAEEAPIVVRPCTATQN